ncbi:MAG: Gmad2 immunoglobulin-like domain-containing protein [Candidatus Taylorbacteria bacterium]|nr:Gmad2 immunoglobulin-like domain-containing protein [Candidatus Taylorbacteria bacterium]
MNKLKLIIIFSVIATAAFTSYVTNFIRSIPTLDPTHSINSGQVGSPQVTPTPAVLPTGGLSDLIRINEPVPDQTVKSPLSVSGEARGYWFFEASFPIRVYDANGKEIGVAVAQAQGEWMTDDFVPFQATLNFKKPATATGTLVLEKDNPSGLPEHDAELRVPVSFDLADWPVSLGACKVGGCSGQLCLDGSEEDVVTTCEYKTEYACYKTAKCERQEDGKCGWTPTEELVACLAEAFQNEPL